MQDDEYISNLLLVIKELKQDIKQYRYELDLNNQIITQMKGVTDEQVIWYSIWPNMVVK